ncbi:hypothetical protein N0V93_008204 [Gnomoniopsis smithogilvyi]|uniref:ATP adenylyltransferase n=1 Tax=Gnomoniopsis smithogilvyi TaxID=1191159 RepID=A0A9W8YNP9_9PEZI|nr:hypothetical protein N0V93_008204 [Gnomoniopsis smithogilvyi]
MDEAWILTKFDSLVQSGLVLYDDNQKIIEQLDGELKFHFILTSALAKKPTLQSPGPRLGDNSELRLLTRDGSDISTAEFEIGDIGSSHFIAANKFCFARPHLMLLTSDGHRRQYEPLDEDDLTAALTALNAIKEDYVIFYNCGQDGGCSRLHKHMQLLPMPKDSFAAFLDLPDGKAPDVPFTWFYHRFEEQSISASSLIMTYNKLLERADNVGRGRAQHAHNAPPGAACPHNVIFTKRWMIVIPRRRAGVNEKIGANAMGMLGYIATANKDEIDVWMQLGLNKTLGQLGVLREAYSP